VAAGRPEWEFMSSEVLSRQALNRALLDRQMLRLLEFAAQDAPARDIRFQALT
jgi:hypothetical protein